MNTLQKFNYFAYPLILNKIKKDGISIAQLSKTTGISQRTLYNLLENENNFEKTSYKNIQTLLSALKINEFGVINDYYRSMYGLGEDDCNVIAIYNVVEGATAFEFEESDFQILLPLLKRFAKKQII